MKAFLKIYCWLLQLYPVSFRARFGDEMEGVFAALLKEKARQGRLACLRTFFREAVSLPIAAVGQHLKMKGVPMAKRVVGFGLLLYFLALVVVAVGLRGASPAPISQEILGVGLGQYYRGTGIVYLSGRHLKCEPDAQSKDAICSIEIAGQTLEIRAQRNPPTNPNQMGGTCRAFYGGREWPCRIGSRHVHIPWFAYVDEALGLEPGELASLRQKYWIENLPQEIFVRGIFIFSIMTTLAMMLALGIWLWQRIHSKVVWGIVTMMVGLVSLCGNLIVWAHLTNGFWD